jgi:hypothetical protein
MDSVGHREMLRQASTIEKVAIFMADGRSFTIHRQIVGLKRES